MAQHTFEDNAAGLSPKATPAGASCESGVASEMRDVEVAPAPAFLPSDEAAGIGWA